MTRRKVKLAWIMNDGARKASLKRRRLGLMKKVNELTILCDVRACLIIFSPDEAEPLVWPSPEVARGLIDRFFALPDIERRTKAMNQESYLRERIKKVQEELAKIQKKNTEAETDHLMYFLSHGHKLTELRLNEMYRLIWYSREKISLLRKRLEVIQHLDLNNLPSQPNVSAEEGTMAATESKTAMAMAPAVSYMVPRVASNSVGARNYPVMENQKQYLMNQWLTNISVNNNSGNINRETSFSTAQPGGYQQVGMGMMPYHETPYHVNLRNIRPPVHQYGNFLASQAGSRSANPNMEMKLMSPHPSHTGFRCLLGLPLQPPRPESLNLNPKHGDMNMGGQIHMGFGFQRQGGDADHQITPRNQLRLYPFGITGRELELMANGGDKGSTKTGTDLGLQTQSLVGADLPLQPHGHGKFGRFGGRNRTGVGDKVAPFDVRKTWLNNNNNASSSH